MADVVRSSDIDAVLSQLKRVRNATTAASFDPAVVAAYRDRVMGAVHSEILALFDSARECLWVSYVSAVYAACTRCTAGGTAPAHGDVVPPGDIRRPTLAPDIVTAGQRLMMRLRAQVSGNVGVVDGGCCAQASDFAAQGVDTVTNICPQATREFRAFEVAKKAKVDKETAAVELQWAKDKLLIVRALTRAGREHGRLRAIAPAVVRVAGSTYLTRPPAVSAAIASLSNWVPVARPTRPKHARSLSQIASARSWGPELDVQLLHALSELAGHESFAIQRQQELEATRKAPQKTVLRLGNMYRAAERQLSEMNQRMVSNHAYVTRQLRHIGTSSPRRAMATLQTVFRYAAACTGATF